ncbi:MAG: FAD-dependent oxidoreductase [Acidimicrobiia bacterium]
MPFGSFDRDENLAALDDGTFDVLVVGGGITGAGVALDAASRGLRTALVERDDFASGTSSKSSKLVHGGLRYLQNGDVMLVYESLRERQRLLRNAPHLVTVLPFLIPVFAGRSGVIPRRVARALGSAMWMYDLTGGLRIGKVHKRLDRDAALAHMPTLDERLAWAYLYYDAQADDARLTLAVARTAALDHGATVLNHAAVTGLLKEGHRVAGALVRAGDRAIEVRARAVVNATGVWADEVSALDDASQPRTLRPAKGIHITVPWHKIRNDIAAVVPVPSDRRSVFVVPWPGPDDPDGTGGPDGESAFTYIGTTDTEYEGDLDDPQCTADDVAYLLDAMNQSLREPLAETDVIGTWAGLRPLVNEGTGSRTADLSRRHRISTSPGGMVTVTGGKLTTYREMAQDAVDAAVAVLGDPLPRRARRSRTARLPLRGAEGWEEAHEHDPHLAGRYGGEAAVLQAMVAADQSLGEPIARGLPYRRVEALYAARYEMATTLDDVLSRRLRARLLARDTAAAAADDIALLVGAELGWDERERAAQVEELRTSIERERQVPGLPRADPLALSRDAP